MVRVASIRAIMVGFPYWLGLLRRWRRVALERVAGGLRGRRDGCDAHGVAPGGVGLTRA